MLPFQFPVLGFLYVSFHPSLIRSHSCSSGACFRIVRFPSGPFRSLLFRFRLLSSTALPFSLFPPSSHRDYLDSSQVLSFPRFSSSFRTGFPFLPSDSAYSAFCWFPFVLPGFTPAAVPPVLAFALTPASSIASVPFRSLCLRFLTTQPLFLLFPSSLFRLTVAFKVLPSAFASGLSALRSAWFPMLPFLLWYSAFLQFLSPLTVSHHRCYFSRRPCLSV